MFKKLVVGVLATGITLTGGIGAASTSVEDTTNSKGLTMLYSCPSEIGKELYAKLFIIQVVFMQTRILKRILVIGQ